MPVVQTYDLQFVNGPVAPVQRWRIEPLQPQFQKMLMGGTIRDVADYNHISNNFSSEYVLNLETEHSDFGKVPADKLLEAPVPDDGQMKPPHMIAVWCSFAKDVLLDKKAGLYIHCQAGGSRTPMALYAILRGVFDWSSQAAIDVIRREKPSWGTAPYHINYIASVEIAMQALGALR